MLHRAKLLAVLLLVGVCAGAQQKPAASKPATHTPAKTSSTPLPSEEVVNAFLQQTFGYDSSLTWKINSIKPAEAEGLAEVDVTISQPQGVQGFKFYVTPDGRHVVNGEILPFGAHPFEAARQQLEKGINGPFAWSGERSGDVGGIQRFAMSSLQAGAADAR